MSTLNEGDSELEMKRNFNDFVNNETTVVLVERDVREAHFHSTLKSNLKRISRK